MSDIDPTDPPADRNVEEILAQYRESLRAGRYAEQQEILDHHPELAELLLRDRAVFEPTGSRNHPSGNEAGDVSDSASVGPPWVLPAAEEPISLEGPENKRQRLLWQALLLGFLIYLLLFKHGGEARTFALAGLESIPFVILAVFAFAGERLLWARVLTLSWLAAIAGCSALTDLLLALSFGGHGERSFLVTLGGLSVSCGFAGLCLLRPVRAWLARYLPIDPQSFVHATALATVTILTLDALLAAVTLPEPPLVAMAKRTQVNQTPASRDEDLRTSVYSVVWLVPAAFLMVGYPVQRNFREACQRLGLHWPRLWQIAMAVIAAAVLLAAMHFADRGLQIVWKAFHWPVTDETALQALFGWATNPIGAVVIGFAAGLGEELAVRGVLQPRLGILLSNLFFTALHAYQYRFDALLSVFVLGLILGLIRKWTNTTTSALVHGLFDCVGLLLPYLAGH